MDNSTENLERAIKEILEFWTDSVYIIMRAKEMSKQINFGKIDLLVQ